MLHSGIFRVLCARLAVHKKAARVANATPLRFLPPAHPGDPWRYEPL